MAEFVVEDLGLLIEPAALAAAGRSLDSSGLLLGEMLCLNHTDQVVVIVTC